MYILSKVTLALKAKVTVTHFLAFAGKLRIVVKFRQSISKPKSINIKRLKTYYSCKGLACLFEAMFGLGLHRDVSSVIIGKVRVTLHNVLWALVICTRCIILHSEVFVLKAVQGKDKVSLYIHVKTLPNNRIIIIIRTTISLTAHLDYTATYDKCTFNFSLNQIQLNIQSLSIKV